MFKETLFTFFTQIFGAFFGFVLAIITARTLGPEGRGVFAFLQNLIVISTLIGSLGITLSNTYFLSSKKYSLSVLSGNTLFLSFVLGIASLGAIFGFRFFLPGVFQGIDPALVFLIGFSLPFYLGGAFLRSLLLGLQRVFRYNLSTVIPRLLALFVLLGCFFIFPSIKTAVLILVLIGILNFFIALFFLEKTFLLKPEINLPAMRDSIRFGLKGQLGDVIQTIDVKLGIFLLNFFLNPGAVGIYSIALFLSNSLGFVPASLGTVLFPKISADSNSAVEELVAKCCRVSFSITFLMGVILIIIAPLTIKIFFGSEFLPGILSVRILTLGMVISSVVPIFGSYMAGKGYPQYSTVVSFIALVFGLGASVVLIPIWGIDGSAWACLISYITTIFTYLIFYKKLAGPYFSFKALFIPKRGDFRSLKRLILNFNKIRFNGITSRSI